VRGKKLLPRPGEEGCIFVPSAEHGRGARELGAWMRLLSERRDKKQPFERKGLAVSKKKLATL